jgi:hypothetical protein
MGGYAFVVFMLLGLGLRSQYLDRHDSGVAQSTYLGHARVTDTYWYLTSTPELMGAAGKRMEERWGGLL